jgi:outer membrane protein assembly factor BamB
MGWAWGQPAFAKGRVYVGTSSSVGYASQHQAGFLALEAATGKVLWRWTTDVPAKGTFGVPGSAACGEGFVFAACLDGRILAFEL